MDIINAAVLIVLAALCVIVVAIYASPDMVVHLCGIFAVVLIVFIFFMMLLAKPKPVKAAHTPAADGNQLAKPKPVKADNRMKLTITYYGYVISAR